MALPNCFFKGTINNVGVGFFKSKIDNSIATAKERVEYVNNIIENNWQFFDEYFNQDRKPKPNFNLCPNTSDFLSDSSPICQELDLLASYILFAPDQPRLCKKVTYNFYNTKEFERICNKESTQNISSIQEDVLDFLIRKGVNYKKETTIDANKINYKDPELKPLLPYVELRKSFSDKMNKLKDKQVKTNDDKVQIARLIRETGLVKNDICDMYMMIKRPIYFKFPLVDSGKYDYDSFFNWNNKEHIKALLLISPRGIDSDLGCMVYDLRKVIKLCQFNDSEKQILNWFINDDIKQKSMAKLLKVSESSISQMLDRIINKIIYKYNEIYEDWEYLNIKKGEYIKCTKCEEIKLASDNNFHKDSRKDNGYRQICKKCV